MKSSVRFPDPRATLEDGLLCVGGELSVATLLEAYRSGIFPWPQEGYPLLWFSPPERGVIDFAELHVSRSLAKEMAREEITITFDHAFSEVIYACATTSRAHERGTWILPEMERAYMRFYEAGYAHSVEAWRGAELVGGLYGVYVEGVFSGESMFYRESNASKRCLLALIEKLRANGLTWMDTQMVTPVVSALGGKYISRDEFLARLQRAKANPPNLFRDGGRAAATTSSRKSEGRR